MAKTEASTLSGERKGSLGWLMVQGLTIGMSGGEVLRVRDVWNDNLEEEMEILRTVVDEFPYVAMDTEFPGVVVRPVGLFKKTTEYQYQTLK